MISYKIVQDFPSYKPSIHFDNSTWWLNELNSCDAEYILGDVLPNIEKIWNGEKIPDVSIMHHTIKLIDTYEFGYDATLINFGKEKSHITYGFGEGEIEVLSEEIYSFMKVWAESLSIWRSKNENS